MTRQISLNEDNKLYGISSIPAVIVSAILAIYYGFGHLTYLPSGTSVMWDSLWNLVIPGLALAPTAFFLTYEIVTSKKEKSTVLHVKRFLGRMAILLIAESSLVAVYLASYFFLAPIISERFAVLCSLLIWLAVLMLGLSKFKGFFDRLEKGRW
jgi:hypothetical protein